MAFFLVAVMLFVLIPRSAALAQSDITRQDAQVNSGETIDGTISAVGNGTLEVRDDGNNLYEVRIYEGTVRVPHGLVLRPGMKVTISGYDLGNFFSAKKIQTAH